MEKTQPESKSKIDPSDTRPKDLLNPPDQVKPSKTDGYVQPDTEVQKAPKTVTGDLGPPKNLQSLPTQDTHKIDPASNL